MAYVPGSEFLHKREDYYVLPRASLHFETIIATLGQPAKMTVIVKTAELCRRSICMGQLKRAQKNEEARRESWLLLAFIVNKRIEFNVSKGNYDS